MIVANLRSSILAELRESTDNSAFTSAEILRFINNAHSFIYHSYEWSFRNKTNTQYSISALTTSSTSPGVTVAVSSVNGMTVGDKIYITDGQHQEEVQVASISTLTLTLVSPGVVNTYASGSKIYTSHIFSPYDCQSINNINISNTTGTSSKLAYSDQATLQLVSPSITFSSIPSNYIPGEYDNTSITSLTADATTSTTSIVDSALPGSTTDYYKGWQVINSAHPGEARVTAYNYTTKTLTLDNAITGQVSGDGYVITKNLQRIYIYPVPNGVYKFDINYVMNLTSLLINEYDVTKFGSKVQSILDQALIYAAVAEACVADKQYDKAQTFGERSDSFITMAMTVDAGNNDDIPMFQPPGIKMMPNLYGKQSSMGGY